MSWFAEKVHINLERIKAKREYRSIEQIVQKQSSKATIQNEVDRLQSELKKLNKSKVKKKSKSTLLLLKLSH